MTRCSLQSPSETKVSYFCADAGPCEGLMNAAGCLSVIASETVDEIGRLAGRTLDVRRFRPNVGVGLLRSGSFQEDRAA